MQTRFKRFTALILSVLMVLTCMPVSVMAEETVIPEDTDAVPEHENVTAAAVGNPDSVTPPDGEADLETEEPVVQESSVETPSVPESTPKAMPQGEQPQEEMPQEDSTAQIAEEQPVNTPEEPVSEEELPAEEPASEVPAEDGHETAQPEPDDRHPLQAAIDTYGHVYVATAGQTDVFGSAELAADTLVFSTANDVFLLLATKYTAQNTVMVWFMDPDGNVVNGYVSEKDLDEKTLLDEDVQDISFLPAVQGKTAVGMMNLFLVNGSYPEAETTPQPVEEPVDSPSTKPEPVITSTEEPVEMDPGDMPVEESLPTTEPAADPETTEIPEDGGAETSDILPAETEEASAQEEAAEIPEETAYDAAGSYVSVTTQTRVFAAADAQAAETYYSGEYLGNFVKDAAVQILTVDFDENGRAWYQVRFLYGDDFRDGRMKWTDYATCWILADETGDSTEEGCTVTDFAYTLEYLQMIRNSGRRMLKASSMNGFSLKNIYGRMGDFSSGQSGLYGSSGKDSDYPQLAKSAAHGTIYATPHYLSGYTVYCLEHTLSGPGEGSGSSQTPKGPYSLVDMKTFLGNSGYSGTTGLRFKEKTLHALGWVLRHTYPFMVLNRSDSKNEVWSRVAGQFAMREVIKQLEGSQYVRSYWKMENFYSFSGGAPAVYLTYARWLAENGIARASITGKINASNQSIRISGSSYVGTVKLTTDADLIRIPKSAGSISGNSGGSDSRYYYVKSGDTIRVTSEKSQFTVNMESLSSSEEEANFLIGIPSAKIQSVLVPVTGGPGILNSAKVTFELKLGEIALTKKSSDGVLLKGAVFELLDSAGNVLSEAATGANGMIVFVNLQPGTYTVREKNAPQGYRLSAETTQSTDVSAGVQSEVMFTNERIMGRIRIVKTDSETGLPIAGAVFSVTRLSGPESDQAADIGTVVAQLTTDAQGMAETGLLPWGEYQITETGVPEGYLDAGYVTTAWIQ